MVVIFRWGGKFPTNPDASFHMRSALLVYHSLSLPAASLIELMGGVTYI